MRKCGTVWYKGIYKVTETESETVGEIQTFRRLINELYPVGIVSIVSDTWDYWKVLTEYAPLLKDEIEARQAITDPDGNELAVWSDN